MDRESLLRQLSLAASMLEAISKDSTFRADLPLCASKIILLQRAIPDVFGNESRSLMAEVRRLRRIWVALFFGGDAEWDGDPEPQPAIVRASRRQSNTPSHPWTFDEAKKTLDGLDDLAIKLLCVLGRVHPKARGVDGKKWYAIGGGLGQEILADAAALRAEYRVVTADEHAWTLAEDAMLLAAGSGVHSEKLEYIAEAAAPAIHELFVDADAPEAVMWGVLGRLLEKRLLHTGSPAHKPSQKPVVCVFHLTAAGARRAQEALTRWRKCSLQGPRPERGKPSDVTVEDDIPF